MSVVETGVVVVGAGNIVVHAMDGQYSPPIALTRTIYDVAGDRFVSEALTLALALVEVKSRAVDCLYCSTYPCAPYTADHFTLMD
jgi:hypothetical protein